jgi:RNA polymerase sigma-70 factor (sigma-E family)
VSTTLGAGAVPYRENAAAAFARDVAATRYELGRFAYLLVGSSAGADDLVAEAWARAWPHYRRGRIDNLNAYLKRSVVNLANGRLRRVRLERREMETRRIDWRSPELAWRERGFEHIEAHDQLWRAIWQLPTEQRAVIVLRHAEDRSEVETAAILGISTGTVKSRLSRGLSTLRQQLERSALKESRR